MLSVGNSRPSTEDFSRLEQYAIHWKEIAKQLLKINEQDVGRMELNVGDNNSRAFENVLNHWLTIDIDATWKKLIEILLTLSLPSSLPKGNITRLIKN